MINKRGQGLSTNAIILIVLGVIVLVILAVGFIAGWDKIAPWISSDNVDQIAQACNLACSTNSDYDFCKERTLKAEGLPDGELKGTCKDFTGDNYKQYNLGINDCSITCI